MFTPRIKINHSKSLISSTNKQITVTSSLVVSKISNICITQNQFDDYLADDESDFKEVPSSQKNRTLRKEKLHI